jgi:hypothetical protein
MGLGRIEYRLSGTPGISFTHASSGGRSGPHISDSPARAHP